ncbi:type II secretion system protein [Nitratifractor sp.]|uniref:pilus assembly FimT family protein n=1 Tax=Nitratifractor sp. TaxID=2268144 RepID=UPI0025D70920|nr:type II secretion system protein [Nitratifractor sp.]
MMRRENLRPAFTLLEMVFVIVVVGILAALAIPRMERDIRQEAADNILSAIRYTQHLALTDDKTDPFDPNWQQTLWMIKFTGGSNAYYTVSADTNKNGIVEKKECAVDPANGKYMYHLSPNPTQADESPNVVVGHKYGINQITTSGACTAKHIAFDHFGRPFNGLKTTPGGTTAGDDYADYMNGDCNLTFTFTGGEQNLIITIEAETGYAYIVGQPDS